MQCDCDFILATQDGWPEHYDNCSSIRKYDNVLKNPDGTISLQNKELLALKTDLLYHLGLDTRNYDLQALFGDVKFVCMGGTKHRMLEFAKYIGEVLDMKTDELVNLTKHSHRYAMYKVGPVLSVSHGIGIPSMTILLQEVIKLLSYAKCKDPVIIRIGTCGGLKIPPGSVVLSTFAVNGLLEKSYDLAYLGKIVKLPAIFDHRIVEELASFASESDGFQTFTGGTYGADDFYRGQARRDGPFCSHTDEEKMSFLSSLQEMGVKNIEMESTALAALAMEAGLRAADVCCTLIDRMQGDQLATSKATLLEWQQRPMLIVGRYIKKYCHTNKLL